MTDAALSTVLATIGWSSEPSDHGRRAVRCSAGHLLGEMTAREVWLELQARELVTWDILTREEWEQRYQCACVEVNR